MTVSSVVFIDSRVSDLQDLLDGLAPGVQAFVLDASSDGVQQIADMLAANSLIDLSSISIVGHGAAGEIDLGSTVLNDADLLAHSAALAQIGSSLAPGGDLQLYACDVASGTTGQQFIADLSQFAGGVDVAAATHDIGLTANGENWTLDASTDPTFQSANVPFTPATLANFQGTLPAAVPNTELWIPTAGDNSSLISAIDTGNGTASNTTTLWSNAGIFGTNGSNNSNQMEQVVFDTTNNLYFVLGSVTPSGGGSSIYEILEGKISDALAGNATLHTLYSETNHNNFIPEIQIDTANHLIYFVDNLNENLGTNESSVFEKVSYSTTPLTSDTNATATNLGTIVTPSTSGGVTGFAMDFSNPNSAEAVFAVNSGGFISVTIIPATPHLYSTTNLAPTATSASFSSLPLNVPQNEGFFTQNGGVAIDHNGGAPVLYFALEDGTVDTPQGQTTSSTGSGLYSYNLTGNSGGTFTPLFQGDGNSFTHFVAITLDPTTHKIYGSTTNFIGSPDVGVWVWNLSGGNAGNQPSEFLAISDPNNGRAAKQFTLDNAPTLSVNNLNPTFTESANNPASDANNNTPVALISGATASDSDNTALTGATVTISTGFFAGDTLSVTVTGNITVASNSGGTLTLTGIDTFAHYQTVLNSVHFTSTSENPTNYGADTSRTITYTVSDGLLSSAPVTSTVTVVGTNDAPVNHLPATQSATEDTLKTITGISVSDVDADPTSAAQALKVTVSVGARHLLAGLDRRSHVHRRGWHQRRDDDVHRHDQRHQHGAGDCELSRQFELQRHRYADHHHQ
jgi:VCBS repeat-containing protein